MEEGAAYQRCLELCQEACPEQAGQDRGDHPTELFHRKAGRQGEAAEALKRKEAEGSGLQPQMAQDLFPRVSLCQFTKIQQLLGEVLSVMA